MRRLEEYRATAGRLLRCGYTTGTCAAAATRAACDLLLGSVHTPAVCVQTPAGIDVVVDVEKSELRNDGAWCAVRKDAGDDPDVTDGVLVWSNVRRAHEGVIRIDGGEGVGRVTKPGLDQPVGSAAINSTPRAMIRATAQEAAQSYGYAGGLDITISIPKGVELAPRTFNPNLGIEGGISVLGTSGIVRPMSEDALVSSIQLELGVLHAKGVRSVLVVPGNYGLSFARDKLGLCTNNVVACSNYVGEAIDEAGRLGFESLLLVGHIGKLAKVAAGVMNTHSRVADCRAEALATHAALAGAPTPIIEAIVNAPTTDAMIDLMDEQEILEQAMSTLANRLSHHLYRRAAGRLRIEAVVFSNARGELTKTNGANELIRGFLHAHQPKDEEAS